MHTFRIDPHNNSIKSNYAPSSLKSFFSLSGTPGCPIFCFNARFCANCFGKNAVNEDAKKKRNPRLQLYIILAPSFCLFMRLIRSWVCRIGFPSWEEKDEEGFVSPQPLISCCVGSRFPARKKREDHIVGKIQSCFFDSISPQCSTKTVGNVFRGKLDFFSKV